MHAWKKYNFCFNFHATVQVQKKYKNWLENFVNFAERGGWRREKEKEEEKTFPFNVYLIWLKAHAFPL